MRHTERGAWHAAGAQKRGIANIRVNGEPLSGTGGGALGLTPGGQTPRRASQRAGHCQGHQGSPFLSSFISQDSKEQIVQHSITAQCLSGKTAKFFRGRKHGLPLVWLLPPRRVIREENLLWLVDSPLTGLLTKIQNSPTSSGTCSSPAMSRSPYLQPSAGSFPPSVALHPRGPTPPSLC